jgi:hypothetical protein
MKGTSGVTSGRCRVRRVCGGSGPVEIECHDGIEIGVVLVDAGEDVVE